MRHTCPSRIAPLAAIFVIVFGTGCEAVPTSPPAQVAVPGELSSLAVERPSTLQQVNLTFEKTIVDPVLGVWEGWVAGDIEGDLRTELQGLRVAGPIWHVDFLWIIDADEPAQSLTFEASGTLNTGTGQVVMNGTVVDGWLAGARVHEEGQAQDPAGAEFHGIITIMRRTVQ